ncbi:tyrosine-type recombinase/integrase [Planctomycetota bacterium]
MNPRTILNDYLAMRRKLGFKLKKHEETLRGFLNFFEPRKDTYLTTELALKWAKKPKNTNPAWWTERLSILRGFAAYWKTIDPRTEVPSLHILLPQYKRPTPHIYSDQEISQIFDLAKKLPTEDSYTYWTLYGLLLATGMRVGEALALDNKDVDLKQGVITIRNAKLNKSRILPLHVTTRKILRQYVQKRDKQFPKSKEPAFFVIADGIRLSHPMAWSRFKKILVEMGIWNPLHNRDPRLHSLRHTFAVRALTEFYRNGQDINMKIHALSTYLGHKDIRCTYWYLTAVPKLMGHVLSRLEKKIGGGL